MFYKIYKGLTASIKRKITLNYVMLYIMITLIISVIILAGSLILYVTEDNIESFNNLENTVSYYLDGRISQDLFETRIKVLSKECDCGILINIDGKEYITEQYSTIFNEDKLSKRIGCFFKERVIPQGGNRQVGYSANELKIVNIVILRPIQTYFIRLKFLYFLLIACLIIGTASVCFFGNFNNKQILKPLFTITNTAQKISISNLSERLDISETNYELKDLAITLNDMLDRLSNDYEKQKRFVSDVSHELRTPISIINGYTNMLKRWGKKDEEILNESIDAIISEADNMKVLVENLLTLVRSDNQTLKFNKEHFYIEELVDEVIRESNMINMKQHTIKSTRLDSAFVFMDPQMIKQTIRIFVDNAMKYTNEKGIIDVNCYNEEGKVRIQIIDNGIGMTPKDIERIFDRFYRSDESRTRETGGHGLGLAIAKVIIIGHNGIIRVKSKLGKGSEFNILFPIDN